MLSAPVLTSNTHKTAEMATTATANFDRNKELKLFDDSKTGVKGLLESGVTTLPRIFVHPPEILSDLKPGKRHVTIPVVDLSGSYSDDQHAAVVEDVRRAASEFGFFQVVNHGIPNETVDGIIGAIKAFNEQPPEYRSQYYRRAVGSGVSYLSNVDLYRSKAASWRDTLLAALSPNPPKREEWPEVCADAVPAWDREVERLGGLLLDLLGEGLGLPVGRLSETCLDGRTLVGHYYPYCPEPDQTLGISAHPDPGALTVLVQDQVGGLQVKHNGEWIDIEPVPGALVINIGDLLQVLKLITQRVWLFQEFWLV